MKNRVGFFSSRLICHVLGAWVIMSLCSACHSLRSSVAQVDLTPVSVIDWQRYLGQWYEVARFDHSFERDMVGVTADYELLDNGKIKVINRGYKHNFTGKPREAIGKTKVPNLECGAILEVSFFLWFYGEYRVLELDPNYQFALVGSSSDRYLWILSRSAILSEKDKMFLLDRAQKRGFKTDQLIWVKHSKE